MANARRAAAHKARRSHVRSRGKSRLGIDWDDDNTSIVEAAIKKKRPFIKHVLHQSAVERDVYAVKLFGKEFGVVANDSSQAITIITIEMLCSMLPAKDLSELNEWRNATQKPA